MLPGLSRLRLGAPTDRSYQVGTLGDVEEHRLTQGLTYTHLPNDLAVHHDVGGSNLYGIASNEAAVAVLSLANKEALNNESLSGPIGRRAVELKYKIENGRFEAAEATDKNTALPENVLTDIFKDDVGTNVFKTLKNTAPLLLFVDLADKDACNPGPFVYMGAYSRSEPNPDRFFHVNTAYNGYALGIQVQKEFTLQEKCKFARNLRAVAEACRITSMQVSLFDKHCDDLFY